MKIVDKSWGREIWLVNNDKYCGKILELNAGYCSSYHCHHKKMETFYCLEGAFTLNLQGEHLYIVVGALPITIYPNQLHSFWANEPTRILEISTTHNERDVYREDRSHPIKTYCFDMDGTFCTQRPEGDYTRAIPFPKIIEKMGALYNSGHTIKIFTARGTTTGIDWRSVTENQLKEWGVKYHELILGKPDADIFIDDRALGVEEWLNS
jgi:quercetin dioxygenase-like cupin family protein